MERCGEANVDSGLDIVDSDMESCAAFRPAVKIDGGMT